MQSADRDNRTNRGINNDDFKKFQQMSDDERRKHPQYVLYLSFMKMNRTEIGSEFLVKPSGLDSPIRAINEDFKKFKQMPDEEKRKHPQYVLYLSFMRMGRSEI